MIVKACSLYELKYLSLQKINLEIIGEIYSE